MSSLLYKIYIIQIWVGSVRPHWMDRAVKINQKYADMHGYTYELLLGTTGSHGPLWSKVDIFTKRLMRSTSKDVFLYMDTDAMVWNSAVAVESFPISHYDLILSGHYHGFDERGRTVTPKTSTGAPAGINAGVWIVRGTRWAKILFKKWKRMKTSGCCQTETDDQVFLYYLIKTGMIPDFEEHALYVNASSLNMDDSLVRLGLSSKPSADFIIHLWGGLKNMMGAVLDDIEAGVKPSLLAV